MRTRALVEQLLAGRPYPASRDELVAWAGEQGADAAVAAALVRLPHGEYRSANDVGEALFPVEAEREEPPPRPRAESGEPPGHEAYVGG